MIYSPSHLLFHVFVEFSGAIVLKVKSGADSHNARLILLGFVIVDKSRKRDELSFPGIHPEFPVLKPLQLPVLEPIETLTRPF